MLHPFYRLSTELRRMGSTVYLVVRNNRYGHYHHNHDYDHVIVAVVSLAGNCHASRTSFALTTVKLCPGRKPSRDTLSTLNLCILKVAVAGTTAANVTTIVLESMLKSSVSNVPAQATRQQQLQQQLQLLYH